MVQPINYNIDVQDPSQAFLSAFQTGSAITKSRLEQEQAARQAEQQEQISTAFERLRQPGATAKNYADLAMLLPETQAKAVRESFAMLNDEQLRNTRTQTGQVFAAFRSGRPDIAISLIEKQILAKRNAGDEEGAKFLETWRDGARFDPKITEDFFGYVLTDMPGGKDVVDAVLALDEERRKAALQPSALKKAEADAEKAVSNAKEAVSDAEIKAANATNAVEKSAADLELAKAKARQTKAEAKEAEVKADIAEQTEEATVLQKKSEAQSAAVAAKFAESKAAMELTKQGFDITKIQEDIKINKENARIAAMNSQIARENNDLRRQELVLKRQEAEEKRDTVVREKAADLQSALSNIDNMLNTADRVLATPKDVIGAAAGPVSSRTLTLRQSTADFEELIATLGSQAFLAQIPNIKGMGSLSNAEGAKLEAALQSFSLRQSPERLIENVTEAQRLLNKARINVTDRSGLPGRRADRPASAAKVTVNGKTYTRPATMTDAQWDAYKKSVGAQ
jgi:hypothetical protein